MLIILKNEILSYRVFMFSILVVVVSVSFEDFKMRILRLYKPHISAGQHKELTFILQPNIHSKSSAFAAARTLVNRHLDALFNKHAEVDFILCVKPAAL